MNIETVDAQEERKCEQCQQRKSLSAFHRRKTKADGHNGRMKICAKCYMENKHEGERKLAEDLEKRKREQEEEIERRKRVEEEYRQKHEENQRQIRAWIAEQPDRKCIACHIVKKAIEFAPRHQGADGEWFTTSLYTRCWECHEKYRQRNRQIYPLCQICSTPAHYHDFLREYHGYRLDIIRVCCANCTPRFETLPEPTQMEWLRRAMVKAYGETSVIYALQYDDSSHCHHIGRTKHLSRRMQEYRQRWERESKDHHVLEEIAFGSLSVEREIRWMLHALKQGWPIDNFELLKTGEDGLGGIRLQSQLVESIADIEPLTAPYETVRPLIRSMSNTCDADIIHWFAEHCALPAS